MFKLIIHNISKAETDLLKISLLAKYTSEIMEEK